MLKAIAIDDEPMALNVIQKFVSAVSFVELTDVFTNAFDAMACLKYRKADLVFLDIRMPDISGIDFFNGLDDPPLVIFTTAHSEYAVKSFELSAVDYLLKPFSPERFEQACSKAFDMHQWRKQQQDLKPVSFFVRSGYNTIQIFFDEILYAESVGNYVQFVLKHKRITSRLTMREAEKLLSRPDFIRVHRRFVIARKQITRVEKKNIVIGDLELPVGETYWEEVKSYSVVTPSPSVIR